jgi:hypothetical protein
MPSGPQSRSERYAETVRPVAMRPWAMAMPTRADTTGLATENELTVESWR